MATVADAGPAQGTGNFGMSSSTVDPSKSLVNSFRISTVMDAIADHVSGQKNDPREFSNLCLSLSRGIDFAITLRDVHARAHELASLLKQVCQGKSDPRLIAAVMVLMLSVKNACERGWFSESDCKELMILASETAKVFSDGSYAEPSYNDLVISTVLTRFFPKIKMHQMFAYLEVKPGFDAYLIDFLMEKDMKAAPTSKICLFVVQTDNIEASSCLITPPKVNFILNGHGVEKRTNVFMDLGPQLPTVVTPLLRYGTNLLQAVGEFNGNYIIAIAHTSEIPYPHSAVLKNYEQLAPPTLDSDSEIIEGPSRVSINCPISFKRIKTPVKGHLCKHIQCFDYDNYMTINSRRPSWRCPHCNQSVCLPDVRIDQKMVEILGKAEATVSDIIISSDGSWNAVTKSDEANQKPEEQIPETGSPQSLDVVYLDDIDEGVARRTPSDSEDRKNVEAATIHDPSVNAANSVVSQGHDHADDDFWSTIFLSTLGQGTVSATVADSNPMSLFPDFDSFTAGLNADAPNLGNLTDHSVQPQRQNPAQNTWLPQSQLGSTTPATGSRRFSPLSQPVTRTPVAGRTLPSQTSGSNSQHRAGTVTNALPSSRVSSLSVTSQQMNVNSHRSPRTPLPSQLSRSVVTMANIAANQAINAHHVPIERQWSSQPVTTTPALSSMQPTIGSALLQQARIRDPTRAPGSGSLPETSVVAPGGNISMGSDLSRTPRAQMSTERFRAPVVANQRISDGVPGANASAPADSNWRPTSRMRGAFVGPEYEQVRSQFIPRPPQQGQTARPPFSPAAQSFIGASGSARPPASAGGAPFL